jgi:hypothetical protein
MWRRVVVGSVLTCAVAATAYQESAAVPPMKGRLSRVTLAAAVVLAASPGIPLASYTGRDSVTGVPRYVTRAFTDVERRVLRERFGVDEPSLLYRNDEGFIVFDSRRDGGLRDYVNTYRVGARSIRHPGETFRELERRVRGKPAAYYGSPVERVENSLDALEPQVRDEFRELLRDARSVGLPIDVFETYRSPERQAYLLGRGDGVTHTATSMHSDRRAMDVRVRDDGLTSSEVRAMYARFQKLAIARGFTLAGEWDPGHVALPDAEQQSGFTSIEALLVAATADAPTRAQEQKAVASIAR